MLNESIGRRVTGGAGKVGLILCGFGIMTALVFSVDIHALWRDLTMVGFGLTIILALHAVVIAIDGMSWRTLLPKRDAATFPLLVWARWVRESTNLLLPVAQVGGEVAGVRLLTLNGVSLRIASASVILDKLSEGMSQLVFAMLGLGILITAHGVSDLALAIASALAIISIAVIGVVAVQRAGGFDGAERWLLGVCTRINPRAYDALASVVETMRSTGRVRPFALSVSQHLSAWCIGSGETWLALRFMGHPISVPTALAIESLGSVITAAGFIVPGAIGVQESGYMAIGVALGLPAELGLAMSLVKRTRQILLGLPALASWQASEVGSLRLHRRNHVNRIGAPPSSASNAYVRRAIRVALRPLVNTGLMPNHLTTLRIATGFAACAACCLGTPAGNWWAGGLWIVSCLFDRADGEFARLTKQCSRIGHVYDYYGDVALNAVIFLAIGIGLRQTVGSSWTIALGMWTALVIAGASILAETLERRIGEKSFPSQAGFDFDDILFVLAPVIAFGHGFALLVGGAIGGPVAVLILGVRLSQLRASSHRVVGAD